MLFVILRMALVNQDREPGGPLGWIAIILWTCGDGSFSERIKVTLFEHLKNQATA